MPDPVPVPVAAFIGTFLSSSTTGAALAAIGAAAASHTHAWGAITSKPTTLSGYGITDAFSGAYADLSGKPTLGTVAGLNVAVSGNAAAGEVVRGNDTRLADSRTPTTHAASHAAGGGDPLTLAQSQVTGLVAALAAAEASSISLLGTTEIQSNRRYVYLGGDVSGVPEATNVSVLNLSDTALTLEGFGTSPDTLVIPAGAGAVFSLNDVDGSGEFDSTPFLLPAHFDNTGLTQYVQPASTLQGLAAAMEAALGGRSPLAGSTSLVTVGTITTGVWQGTAIADTYIASAATWNAKQNALTAASQAEMEAGTEAAIRSMSPLRVKQAIAALGGGLTNPMNAAGDLIIGGAGGAPERLAAASLGEGADVLRLRNKTVWAKSISAGLPNDAQGVTSAESYDDWASGLGSLHKTNTTQVYSVGANANGHNRSRSVDRGALFFQRGHVLSLGLSSYTYFVFALNTAPASGTETVYRMGQYETGNNDQNGFYFRVSHAGGIVGVVRNGASETVWNTGVSAVSSAVYRAAILHHPTAGTKFFLNDSDSGWITTNIPSDGPSRPINRFTVGINNSATASPRRIAFLNFNSVILNADL